MNTFTTPTGSRGPVVLFRSWKRTLLPLLAIATLGCGHVQVHEISTAAGPGYELSCANERKCAKVARKRCRGDYVLLTSAVSETGPLWRIACQAPPSAKPSPMGGDHAREVQRPASRDSQPVAEAARPDPNQMEAHTINETSGPPVEQDCRPGFRAMAGAADEVQVGCVLYPGQDPSYPFGGMNDFTNGIGEYSVCNRGARRPPALLGGHTYYGRLSIHEGFTESVCNSSGPFASLRLCAAARRLCGSFGIQ